MADIENMTTTHRTKAQIASHLVADHMLSAHDVAGKTVRELRELHRIDHMHNPTIHAAVR